jgi:hypothetical protein
MESEVQRRLDIEEIRDVRRRWAFGRDLQEWDLLRSVFHPEATVHVSWFKGPATEFVKRSAELAKLIKPEEHGKHSFGNVTRTEVRGTRAIHEVEIQILNRAYINGVLFDNTCWARFLDRFEKHEGRWKLLQMTCIYEKDRLDPVIPGTAPAGFYDGLKLEGSKTGSAFLAFRLSKIGRQSVPMIYSLSDEEKQLRQEYRRWLEA